MRILALNCGSATLKFDLLDGPDATSAFEPVAAGLVDGIGGGARASLTVDGNTQAREVTVADQTEAFDVALALLREANLLAGIDAVGHRVVHGGQRYRDAVRLDADVVEAIDAVSDLAPLHNRPAVAVIRAARDRLGADLPMVAAFDTAFFADLPPAAATYALPKELSARYGIRRFGFHGLAHSYMVRRFRALRRSVMTPRLITLQLGSGCSVTASRDGAPLDTSMGFTPLEGLIMGTRTGDLDPSLPLFLQTAAGLTPAEVETLLNTQSGLLGLSGRSADMRELLAAVETGDADATLAVDAFCARVRKYVGAYLAVLGGADAIVFGGGIGEHSAAVRARVCDGFAWAGLELDVSRNESTKGGDAPIEAGHSDIEVWVVKVDEAVVIATEVARVLAGR